MISHSREEILKDLPRRREIVREAIGEEKAEALNNIASPIKTHLESTIGALLEVEVTDGELDATGHQKTLTLIKKLREFSPLFSLALESNWCRPYHSTAQALIGRSSSLAIWLGEAALFDNSKIPNLLDDVSYFIDRVSDFYSQLISDAESKKIYSFELFAYDLELKEMVGDSLANRLSNNIGGNLPAKVLPCPREIISAAASVIDAVLSDDEGSLAKGIQELSKYELADALKALTFLLSSRDQLTQEKLLELNNGIVAKLLSSRSATTQGVSEEDETGPEETVVLDPKISLIIAPQDKGEFVSLEEALGFSKPTSPAQILAMMLAPFVKDKKLFEEVMKGDLTKRILFQIFGYNCDPSPHHEAFINLFKDSYKTQEICSAISKIAKAFGRDELSAKQKEKRVPAVKVHLFRIFWIQWPSDHTLLRQFRKSIGVEISNSTLSSGNGALEIEPSESSQEPKMLVIVSNGREHEFKLPVFDIVPKAPLGTVNERLKNGSLTQQEFGRLAEIHSETCALTGIKYTLGNLTPEEVEGLNTAVVTYSKKNPSEKAEWITDFVFCWMNPQMWEELSPRQKDRVFYSKRRDKDSTPSDIKGKPIDEERAAVHRFLGIEEPETGFKAIMPKREAALAEMILTPSPFKPRENRLVHGNRHYRGSEHFDDPEKRTPLALVAERYLGEVASTMRLNAWLPMAYSAASSVRDFHRDQVEPILIRRKEVFLDPAVVKEIEWRAEYISGVANFYEGPGRSSDTHYMTWLQVLALKRILFEYELYLRMLVQGLSDFKALAPESDYEEPEIGSPILPLSKRSAHGKAGGDA